MTKQKEQEILPPKSQFQILLVLAVCILITIIITFIQENSKGYIERNYFEIRNKQYSGVITDLLPDRIDGHMRFIRLSNNSIKRIPFFIHDRLSLGDFVYKKKNSDSIIYILKENERIYEDTNFYREKYLKLKSDSQ